jgi:hypothetical protein
MIYYGGNLSHRPVKGFVAKEMTVRHTDGVAFLGRC